MFINYITAAANDACKEAKRQTMSEADVLTALEELHFGELIPELKQSLEGRARSLTCPWVSLPARWPLMQYSMHFAAFKEDSKAKYSKKTSSDQKKRKAADKRTPAGKHALCFCRRGTPMQQSGIRPHMWLDRANSMCAGRDQKKTVSSAPAGAAGAVPHMPPVAVPMQHLAAAAPNLVQSLMLQQLAQLSPQQQQQYVNQVRLSP